MIFQHNCCSRKVFLISCLSEIVERGMVVIVNTDSVRSDGRMNTETCFLHHLRCICQNDSYSQCAQEDDGRPMKLRFDFLPFGWSCLSSSHEILKKSEIFSDPSDLSPQKGKESQVDLNNSKFSTVICG